MQNYISRSPLVVALTQNQITLAPGVDLLKRDQYAQFISAQDGVREAKLNADKLTAQAQAEQDKIKQDALETGRREAQAEVLDTVLQLRTQMKTWSQEMEPELVKLVLACLEQVIQSSDSKLLVEHSVNRALDVMGAAKDICLQVHEADLPYWRTQTEILSQRYGLGGVLRVEVGLNLSPGDCVVESPLGLADLRISSQVRLIQQTIEVK